MSHRVCRKIDYVVMGRSSGLIEAATHVEFGAVGRGERQIHSHAARMQRRPVPGIGRVARVGVEAAVAQTPEVLEYFMVAGCFDYLVKVRVKHMVAYRTFLGDTLVRLPDTRQPQAYTVMEEVKGRTELPV